MPTLTLTTATDIPQQPDWVQRAIYSIDLSGLSSGEVLVGILTLLAALAIIYPTIYGVRYAAHQFRVSNTIRYLEEFRQSAFKERIDSMRVGNHRHGPYWRVFGLMTEVIELKHAGKTIPVPFDKERISFALDAKYISHYFDYAGILISKGHMDRELFFYQLCEVVIDNWQVLAPYIYYQRLIRFDKFGLAHMEQFKAALSKLKSDPDAPPKVVEFFAEVIAAYQAPSTASGTARFVQRLGDLFRPESEPALDNQIWFERLYLDAIQWRERHRRPNRYAPNVEAVIADSTTRAPENVSP